MKTFLKRTILLLVILVGILMVAFRMSPYPSVLLIRYNFDEEAKRVNEELEKFVPDNIVTLRNIQYDTHDKVAMLDAYFHRDSILSNKKLPVIVWTHGGGLVSGTKDLISNYCKILASRGYAVIAIDYSVAPEGKYPLPIQQLNRALHFISSNAALFHADTSIFILAGDSGGSMISAATANIITSPDYARRTRVEPGLQPNQLKGLLLYCGIYEIDNLKMEGAFGSFLRTVMWAYFDKKDISKDEYAKTASVTHYLTGSFPPAFISAGNNDPLLPQSRLIAKKLSAVQVPMDTLFFPANREPALEHEYQFNMDVAGKMALERSIRFLHSIVVNARQ